MITKRGCSKPLPDRGAAFAVTPPLKAGEESAEVHSLEDGPRLEDATGLDGDRSRSSVFRTGFLIMLASSPALERGYHG